MSNSSKCEWYFCHTLDNNVCFSSEFHFIFFFFLRYMKDSPPILPTDMNQGYKQLKAKLGSQKVRPWKWMPFTNPARKVRWLFCFFLFKKNFCWHLNMWSLFYFVINLDICWHLNMGILFYFVINLDICWHLNTWILFYFVINLDICWHLNMWILFYFVINLDICWHLNMWILFYFVINLDICWHLNMWILFYFVINLDICCTPYIMDSLSSINTHQCQMECTNQHKIPFV